jgi:hypothetical protein
MIVLAAAVAGACTGSTEPALPKSPVGDFQLSQVNGANVPITTAQDGVYKLEIAGGTLAVSAAGSFVAKTTTRETIAGIVSLYVDSTYGTWLEPTPGNLQFTFSDNAVTTGSWAARTLTFSQTVDGVTTTATYSR